MSIRGIIFDVDGVLVDSEPFIAEAAARMLAETYGVIVSRKDFAPFIGTGEDRFISGAAQRHGVLVSMPRDKLRTYEIYLQIIRGRLRAVPGALPFIAAARQRGLKLALATSADQRKLAGNLAEIQLPPESFDAVVTGNDITRKKPDPQAFLLAAERLGLPPRQCLVVEDAVNGIEAAVAAGSPALGLTTTFPADALCRAGATWTAPDLARVPPGLLDT